MPKNSIDAEKYQEIPIMQKNSINSKKFHHECFIIQACSNPSLQVDVHTLVLWAPYKFLTFDNFFLSGFTGFTVKKFNSAKHYFNRKSSIK
jgi:hypothetical protein